MGAESSKKFVPDTLSLKRIRGVLGIEKSLLLLFRFKSISESEWKGLLEGLNLDTGSDEFMKVRTAVTRETVAEEFDLSRNSETPMFTNRSSRDSSINSVDSARTEKEGTFEDEESSASEMSRTLAARPIPLSISKQDETLLRQAKKQLRAEAHSFFLRKVNTEKGKASFILWLFKLITRTQHKEKADVGTGASASTAASTEPVEQIVVGVPEIMKLFKFVKRDRIDPASLVFKKIQSSNAENASETELLEKRMAQQLLKEFDIRKMGYLDEADFTLLAECIILQNKVRIELADKSQQNKVGPYALKHTLGRGSFGVVRYGENKKTGEKFAIKIMKTGDINDMSRIDTEIKAMMMLKHPNVVRLEKVMNNDDHVFFIAELCGGGTLYEYTKGRPLSESQTRYFFTQMVEAVQYCHSMGVCHRDLKLDNLVLDNSGNLKVTDFGHAGIFQKGWDLFQTQLVGGLCHLAPEQLSGTPYRGEKNDIWALGVIFYALLLGKAPFFGTPAEMLQKIMNSDYKVPDDTLSPEAETFLKAMLETDPTKRPTCKKMKRHPWMQLNEIEKPTLNKYRIRIDTSLEIFNGSVHDIYAAICTCLSPLGILAIFNNNQQNLATPEKRPLIKCHYPERQVKFTFVYHERDDQAFMSFYLSEGDCHPFRAIKPLLLKEIEREEKRLRFQKKKRQNNNPGEMSPSQAKSQRVRLKDIPKESRSRNSSPTRSESIKPEPQRKRKEKDKERDQEEEEEDDGKEKEKGLKKDKSTISKKDRSTIIGPDVSEYLEISVEEVIKLEDFVKTQAESVLENAALIVTAFEKAFHKSSRHLSKPNVLMVGVSGCGKSSVINTIFGEKKVQEGIQITKNFLRYNQSKVVIYNFCGLNVENKERFKKHMTKIQRFLDSHREEAYGETVTPRHQIHVIWYIIDSTKQFAPEEAEICTKIFRDIPLIFLLNKSDLVSRNKSVSLRSCIEDLNLPNCHGIFNVIGRPVSPHQNWTVCSACGSDDLLVIKKKSQIKCEECKHVESLTEDNGLEITLQKTCEVLPSEQRTTFISTQNVSSMEKEASTRNIIEEFWKNFPRVYTSAKLLRIIAEMIARLCQAWEIKHNGHAFAEALARELLKRMDKMNVPFHKKRQVHRIQATALGILWNESLKQFTRKLLDEWTSEPTLSVSNMLTKCNQLFTNAFENFTEKRRSEIEHKLLQFDIRTVLDDRDLLSPIGGKMEKNNSGDKEERPLKDSSERKRDELVGNGKSEKTKPEHAEKIKPERSRKEKKSRSFDQKEQLSDKILPKEDPPPDTPASGLDIAAEKYREDRFPSKEEVKHKKSKTEANTPAKDDKKRPKMEDLSKYPRVTGEERLLRENTGEIPFLERKDHTEGEERPPQETVRLSRKLKERGGGDQEERVERDRWDRDRWEKERTESERREWDEEEKWKRKSSEIPKVVTEEDILEKLKEDRYMENSKRKGKGSEGQKLGEEEIERTKEVATDGVEKKEKKVKKIT